MAETNSKPESKLAPPYVPYKTLANFLDGLRAGGKLPHSIDRSVMTSMSGFMQSQLLQSMRFLGLIDQQDAVTNLLERIHAATTDDARKPVMAEMLAEAYREILGTLPLGTATLKQLQDRFREIGKVDGETLEKALRFYVKALGAADVPHSRFLKLRQKRTPGQKRPAANSDRQGKPDDVQKTGGNSTPAKPHEVPEGMMDIPIYLPGKKLGRVIITDDLTTDDCDMIDAILRAVAKRRAANTKS